VIGRSIGAHHDVLDSVRKKFAERDSGGRGQQTFDLRVTIQQIGSAMFRRGEEAAYAEFRERVTPAGRGWLERLPAPLLAIGLYERADDWCATSFVYCEEAQPVPRVDVMAATADLGRATGSPVVR